MSRSTKPLDAAAFIRANLPVEAVPSIPEIRLHRAGPQSGLWRLAEADPESGTPYWAHYWGGGLALARYILDHPSSAAGRSVLDLGTGSGIVAIAAARAAASRVMAADTDRHAMAALGLNAALNGVEIVGHLGDLTQSAPPAVDVIVVGDLFYEPALASRVVTFLDRCLDQGIEILVGDPWRAHLPRSRLSVLAEYRVADFGDGRASSRSAVFAFRPAGATDRPAQPLPGISALARATPP